VLIGEGRQDIRSDCRPDHLAVERERAPDDREAVPLLDDDRGRPGRLGQAASNARREHAQRVMARRQKLEQASWMHRPKDQALVAAVELDGQMGRGPVLLEGPLPCRVGLEDGLVERHD